MCGGGVRWGGGNFFFFTTSHRIGHIRTKMKMINRRDSLVTSKRSLTLSQTVQGQLGTNRHRHKSQTLSQVTNTVTSHRHRHKSQTPSQVTDTVISHKHRHESQTPSQVTNTVTSHRHRHKSQTPSQVTNSHKHRHKSQTPLQVVTPLKVLSYLKLYQSPIYRRSPNTKATWKIP